MSDLLSTTSSCIIIGASHGGVNLAFNLRKEGWRGDIHVYDADPELPYHRPPLSKAYLLNPEGGNKNLLKSPQSYSEQNIQLHLGQAVTAINTQQKTITLKDGNSKSYDKLVLAVGARPIVPPIEGIAKAANLYTLRTLGDVNNIQQTLQQSALKRVVIIGGGYIGLEAAASLKKMGAEVSVLEREDNILARVTSPVMADFFRTLHQKNGVGIYTQKNVVELREKNNTQEVHCSDGSYYRADIILLGVGIHVNVELAQTAGLTIANGICVDESCKTSDDNIYAIGDCTFHHNPTYNRQLRLESVQNAVDQAKTAARALTKKSARYHKLPWFWSDQYDVKLQIVGLSDNYNEIIKRDESHNGDYKFSIWYFKGNQLLSVEAVNNAKAYVVATKIINDGIIINKNHLRDLTKDLKTLLNP